MPLAVLLGILVSAAEPSRPGSEVAVDYDRDVRPILAASCFRCHGPEKRKGGLRLDIRSEALAGGDSGPVISPGKPEESLILDYVSGTDPDVVMPPKGEGDRLDRKQVDVLKRWIEQGAPRSGSDDEPTPAISRDHWSFRPIRRTEPPTVRGSAPVRNLVDSYIQAELDRKGVAPSPVASSGTLHRRLALDLTGILPGPEEAKAFLQDHRPDAYERLVDRLLASPHFGERWGRHWLDLARYADSNGYERDDVRPNAWRFRDWVVNALNEDLPYDRFVVSQIAGDLLPDTSLAAKTAVGFHRMTTKNTESGINKDDYRNREVVDRVNTVGAAFLGLTIGCAQCHSHKYDPISQKEYYRLYAFLDNTSEIDVPVEGTRAEQAEYKVALDEFKAKEARLKSRKAVLDAMLKEGVDAWRAKAGTELAAKLALLEEPAELVEAISRSRESRNPGQALLVEKLARELSSKVDDLGQTIRHLAVEERHLPKPAINSMAEASEGRRPTHVRLRGDFKQKAAEVEPGALDVLPPLKARGGRADRLDLANWLVSADHPLTARVAVNHVWAKLFGKGMVETADDFGVKGRPPTHPELLDRLAWEFQRSGWSRKQLIRLIVTSDAYRRSSATRPDLQAIDPLNSMLARQTRFRVEGEIVRDAFLSASGLLRRSLGGKTIRPPLSESMRDVGYKYKIHWNLSDKPDRYRRGLYVHFVRSNPYPTLLTFDCPESTVYLSTRNRSNTPLQALTTLNDPAFVECSRALGSRLLREFPNAPARLRGLGLICLGREFDSWEMEALSDLLREERAAYDRAPVEAGRLAAEYAISNIPDAETASWIAVARAALNLDEFLTRE